MYSLRHVPCSLALGYCAVHSERCLSIQLGNTVDSSGILDLLTATAISTTTFIVRYIVSHFWLLTMGVKEDIDQKIASKPVYVVSKSFCPFCKIAKQVLQRYNIPADNILIQADMWAMFIRYSEKAPFSPNIKYCHYISSSSISYMSGPRR